MTPPHQSQEPELDSLEHVTVTPRNRPLQSAPLVQPQLGKLDAGRYPCPLVRLDITKLLDEPLLCWWGAGGRVVVLVLWSTGTGRDVVW